MDQELNIKFTSEREFIVVCFLLVEFSANDNICRIIHINMVLDRSPAKRCTQHCMARYSTVQHGIARIVPAGGYHDAVWLQSHGCGGGSPNTTLLQPGYKWLCTIITVYNITIRSVPPNRANSFRSFAKKYLLMN